MIYEAIAHCGRPMILSLSPGETPLSEAPHLSRYATMGRVSDDMWDSWKYIEHQFELLNQWSPFIQKNHWPDADMLPLGHISLSGRPNGPDRMSKLTRDETYTLLTLWSIARSPLIMGGELLSTPQWVISLLQNREVIAVDQHSMGNHQVFRNDSEAIWTAQDSVARARYLALFNLRQESQTVDFRFDMVPGLEGSYMIRDLWKGEDIGNARDHFSATIGPHGAGLFNLSEIR